MVVSAPDSVLAEASLMKPRPSFASTLLTAEPSPRIIWWPERRHLDGGTLSRLGWMLKAASGEAWLVVDPAEDESPSTAEVTDALPPAGLTLRGEQAIGRGEIAIRVAPAG